MKINGEGFEERLVFAQKMRSQACFWAITLILLNSVIAVFVRWFLSGGYADRFEHPIAVTIFPIGAMLYWFICCYFFSENHDWLLPNVNTFPHPFSVFGPLALTFLFVAKWIEYRG